MFLRHVTYNLMKKIYHAEQGLSLLFKGLKDQQPESPKDRKVYLNSYYLLDGKRRYINNMKHDMMRHMIFDLRLSHPGRIQSSYRNRRYSH